MKEKLFAVGTDFWVTDEQGGRAFLVDGKILHIRPTLELKDPSGAVVATIRKKLVAIRETMEIERDGAPSATVHKVLVSPLHHRYVIDIDGGGQLEAVGNFVDKEFQIQYDGQVVAQVSRAWFRIRDTYGIDVAPGQDEVLLIAVAIAMDRIHHEEEERRDR